MIGRLLGEPTNKIEREFNLNQIELLLFIPYKCPLKSEFQRLLNLFISRLID